LSPVSGDSGDYSVRRYGTDPIVEAINEVDGPVRAHSYSLWVGKLGIDSRASVS
jgi:hypothetical protein